MSSILVRSSFPALSKAMRNWPSWSFAYERDEMSKGWIVQTFYE